MLKALPLSMALLISTLCLTSCGDNNNEVDITLTKLAEAWYETNLRTLSADPKFTDKYAEICILGPYGSTDSFSNVSKLWGSTSQPDYVSTDDSIQALIGITNDNKVEISEFHRPVYVETITCTRNGKLTIYPCARATDQEICLRAGE